MQDLLRKSFLKTFLVLLNHTSSDDDVDLTENMIEKWEKSHFVEKKTPRENSRVDTDVSKSG